MNTYFLCATQAGNLGDLIINKMLVDELCRYGIVYVDTAGVPDSFKQYLLESKDAVDLNLLNVSAKNSSFLRLLFFLKKNKVKLAVQSPGPVYDFTGIRRSVYLTQNYLFKSIGVKTYGIGKCCSSLIARNKKMRINGIDHYHVRSVDSVQYINNEKDGMASYIPDLAFLLRYYVDPSPKQKKVAVSFRGQSTDKVLFLSKCKQVVNTFVEKGFKVQLYYQVSSDRLFMEELFRECRHQDVSFKDSILWYDDLNFYADKMFVVSNRLHSLLTGAVYDCVPLALYDNVSECTKLRHVLDSVFTSDILEFQGEQPISSSIENYVDNYDHLLKMVQTVSSNSAQLCREIINKIANNL